MAQTKASPPGGAICGWATISRVLMIDKDQVISYSSSRDKELKLKFVEKKESTEFISRRLQACASRYCLVTVSSCLMMLLGPMNTSDAAPWDLHNLGDKM